MILVTGASGFVGGAIMRECEGVIPCPSLKGLNEDEIRKIVLESGADTIVHTAAISDIGACEKDPDASYLANVQIPIWLAKASKGIKLVCFSSDQVYSGSGEVGPFFEDMVCPANTYAKHKLEMENRVLDICPDAVMLRAEWMFDCYAKRYNYFMGILNATESVRASSTEFRGVTYVKEVCENIDKVIRLDGGAYNFGSETTKSMFEITKDFLKSIGKEIPIIDVPSNRNLWVNCDKARSGGVVFSSVEDGLIRCAKDYGIIK
jgi:dTDP-4-dehydrorhamnose reductase